MIRLPKTAANKEAIMKALLISFAILLSFTFVSAQASEQLTIKQGQQKVSRTGRITVKFVELIEDSRCPADVNCVWAGVARIKVRLSRRGKTADVELNTTDKKTTTFQGYSVALKDLQPRQSTTSKYSPSAYSATLVIKRA
jgi:hypothetical protein